MTGNGSYSFVVPYGAEGHIPRLFVCGYLALSILVFSKPVRPHLHFSAWESLLPAWEMGTVVLIPL